MKVDTYNRMIAENLYKVFSESEMEKYHIRVDNSIAKIPALNDSCDLNGYVILDIHPNAVRELHFGVKELTVNVKFRGVAVHLVIPYHAISGAVIYLDEFDCNLLVGMDMIVISEEPATAEPVADSSATDAPNVVSLFPKKK